MNPIRTYRTDYLHMTQQELADLLNLAEYTIRRVEQGTLMTVPLPLISHALSNHSLDLQQAYLKWKKHERVLLVPKMKLLEPPFNYLKQEPNNLHPFSKLRVELTGKTSVNAAARLLLVPGSEITRYERGESGTIPVSLWNALYQSGYPYLKDLDSAVSTWIQERAINE